MSFSLFFQSLINGLNQGAIYALIALGYTMVYGIIRMINFAHGDFIMIGAYTLFYTIPLMVNAGMPAWLAVILAIAVCAVVGVLVEILAYRPVRKAGSMSALITALAMSIFLENLAMVLFGAKPHNVQAIFSLPTITVGTVALPLNVLLTIAIGLGIMIALQLFVKKTKLGKAMRAVPQDKDASTLVGINVNKIRKADLRRSLGVVLQDVNLFTGTVMDNIRYGNLDATDEECIAAAKLAGADDFITRLPDGYDTMLTGNGAQLSQGQRQLISIARAAVADPPAMILDEATSSIDTRTEAIVQEGMDKLMEGRTTFVIAHRLSTVRNSDAIICLDHGRIIERGNHDELIAKRGYYYQLYTGAFELE